MAFVWRSAVTAACALVAVLGLAPVAAAEEVVRLHETFDGAGPVGARWTDGSVHGRWQAVYDGYGVTTVAADSSGAALAQAPQVSTQLDETHGSLVTSTDTFGDIDLTVRLKTVRQLRTPVPNPWETAWVLWNFTDDHHFYYLALKTNGWELVKEDPAPLVAGAGGCEWPTYVNCKYPGAQRYLVTSSSPRFNVGAWHDVRVRQVGGTIDIWANGQHLTTFVDTDSPYRSGRVGLYNEDADVRFDDVVVRSPEGTASGVSPAAVERIAGVDRYATAAALAERVAPDGATTAVLASGSNANLIDSLVAGPLAVAEEAPVLLTAPDHLPGATANALATLGVTRVRVIGGPAAVSDSVLAELRRRGLAVDRLAGATAPETAALVAAEVGTDRGAVVVSRESSRLVDGLAASGPAASIGRPIVLVSGGAVPDATSAALAGVEDVWVVGGDAAVAPTLVDALGARRIAGVDRWSTAAAVARAAAEAGGATDTVVVSSGEDGHLVDALAASAFGGPVLLSAHDTLPTATAGALRTFAADPSAVLVAGGAASLSDAVAIAAHAAVA